LDVPGDVVAGDAIAAKSISVSGNGQQFFRVVVP